MRKTLNLLARGLILGGVLGGLLGGSAMSSMAANIDGTATFTLHVMPSLTLSASTPVTFGQRFIPATGIATYEISPFLGNEAGENGVGSVTITTRADHYPRQFYHVTTSPPDCPSGVNFTVTKRLQSQGQFFSGPAAEFTLYPAGSTTRLYLGGTLRVDADATPGPGACSFNVIFTENGSLA